MISGLILVFTCTMMGVRGIFEFLMRLDSTLLLPTLGEGEDPRRTLCTGML